MRTASIIHSANQRIRHPITWWAILIFSSILIAMRWGSAFPMQLHDFISPILSGFGFLFLSPVPWQWCGSDAPMAPNWRGLLQAIPWNGLWIFALWLLININSPQITSQPPPPPPVSGTVASTTPPPPSPRPRKSRRALLFLGANFGFSVLIGWLLAEKEKAEARESSAREAANAARAKALQSQMNPHVLFNAISGIAELVREDPEAAEDALINLAGLLRTILDHGAKAQAPLLAERNLVEKYLGMESIRLGRRLNITWEWDSAVDTLQMPPLLLQPLVENAIKHGIAPNRGGGELKIISKKTPDNLSLEVINSGRPLSGDPMEGVGIANLKSRLELLGCKDWQFAIWVEEGLTHAKLLCSWRNLE